MTLGIEFTIMAVNKYFRDAFNKSSSIYYDTALYRKSNHCNLLDN